MSSLPMAGQFSLDNGQLELGDGSGGAPFLGQLDAALAGRVGAEKGQPLWFVGRGPVCVLHGLEDPPIVVPRLCPMILSDHPLTGRKKHRLTGVLHQGGDGPDDVAAPSELHAGDHATDAPERSSAPVD